MITEKQYEESRLLIMLSQDSQYAFQVLFDRYKNHIYKVAMMYVKLPSMAEEIVQDVFMKVWLNRKAMGNIQSFESWLFIVSKNLILNYKKRLAAEWIAFQNYQLQHNIPENSTDYKVRTSKYNELLAGAVAQLSAQQQMVYRMAREEQLSYQEIAQRLNVSPLTVKTHLARALNALRTFLKQHGEIIPILVGLSALK